MTLHLHHMTGCAPAPLAHYLKALAVLRLVGEQKDPEARGFWQDEHFCLLTALDRDQLERFFLEEYRPTPFVSPWNKGAGFFKKDDPGMAPLEASVAPRFRAFRAGIALARQRLDEISKADAEIRALKDQTKAKKGMTAVEKGKARALKSDPEFKQKLAAAERRFKQLKEDLFTPLQREWRGLEREWLDAALVLPEAGKPTYPALLGTGGNDGNLDFTNNAMQRLGDLFDFASSDGSARTNARDLLRQALWSVHCRDLRSAKVGQFLPGSAGGANNSTGPEGQGLLNPWDFVFMMEGTILFSARATRRLDPAAVGGGSAPFAVRAHPTGHATAGQENVDRGEQWMPLWSRPTSLGDLRTMLGEARAQFGKQVARRPIDVARAVARLGVARGITGFTRFGYAERFGQSTMAVPLGRIEVRERPHARLIDDLAPWLDRLQRDARDQNAPARLVHAERRLADAVFAVLTHDETPARWQAVLVGASAVEAIQVAGTAFRAGPIPPLSAEWLRAADDGSVEWRLACALGSAAGGYDHDHRPRDSVRCHWSPLDRGGHRYREKEKRIVRGPRVVATSIDALADCAAIVERRLIEATQRGDRHLPLVAAPGAGARPADLAELVAGRADLSRVVALARGLMALRWGGPGMSVGTAAGAPSWPDEPWIAIRLACLPWPLDERRTVPVDDAVVRRLRAGDAAAAVELALRRLRAAGLRAPLRVATADAATAQLWGAALAFPISRRTAHMMARRFDPKSRKESP